MIRSILSARPSLAGLLILLGIGAGLLTHQQANADKKEEVREGLNKIIFMSGQQLKL